MRKLTILIRSDYNHFKMFRRLLEHNNAFIGIKFTSQVYYLSQSKLKT